MKFNSISDSGNFALINALLIAGFFLLTGLFVSFFISIPFIYLVVSTLVLFAFAFALIRHNTEKLLSEKIRVLYKIIRKQKSAALVKTPVNRNIRIENVEKEVEQWSEQQQQEIDELKRMEIYRREFLGNISHELKTPIFNIQGYILTLLEGGMDDPSINKEYLARSEKSIDRMIALVNDLETITKLESGELKLHYSDFDLLQLSQEIIELLQTKALQNDIRLMIDATSRPLLVHADRGKIAQVITNLIDNSLKYGKRKGVTRISFFDMDETILTEVSDDGIGVEEHNLPRLFERFYRTDKARSRDEGGSGLGLAIVKHIIEAHRQQVNVRSSVGIGTTFGFTLQKAWGV